MVQQSFSEQADVLQRKAGYEALREDAWLGDAVLSLYARSWILKNQRKMDGVSLQRFTSNQFLCCFGQPTAVEAEIGVIYREKGLDAAFTHIEQKLLPLFLRQSGLEKRAKTLG